MQRYQLRHIYFRSVLFIFVFFCVSPSWWYIWLCMICDDFASHLNRSNLKWENEKKRQIQSISIWMDGIYFVCCCYFKKESIRPLNCWFSSLIQHQNTMCVFVWTKQQNIDGKEKNVSKQKNTFSNLTIQNGTWKEKKVIKYATDRDLQHFSNMSYHTYTYIFYNNK